ncbi:MAG: hypothetical protein NTX40_02960 [Planctomycetota bacterium]|nr:hypothetical protein [Planctomycetota bacterium]
MTTSGSRRLSALIVLLLVLMPSALLAQESTLAPDTALGNGALVWIVPGGHSVHIDPPEVSIDGKTGSPLKLTKQTVDGKTTLLEYAVSLNAPEAKTDGYYRMDVTLYAGDGDWGLRQKSELVFSKPIKRDVRVTQALRIPGAAKALITEKTRTSRDLKEIYSEPRLIARELSAVDPLGAYFNLGQKSTDLQHVYLSMPIIGIAFREGKAFPQGKPLFLSIACDPYAGSQFYGLAMKGEDAGVKVTVSHTYAGSMVPVKQENRYVVLKAHRKGADGIINTFYATIPEIVPAPAWTYEVAANYYDYFSQEGKGWFANIQKLAEVFPDKNQRGKIVCCLHGWYDFDGMYTFDYDKNALADSWVVHKKYPMDKQEMHRRIRFATDLGFRVVLYFADGMNCTGVPNDIRKGHAYVYANGKTRGGWVGPTGGGGPALDPSSPVVQRWFAAYLEALLKEYGKEVSGFVFDETNYFIPGDVSYRDKEHPAYADRAMMSLMRDLSSKVQQWQKTNADLVFLEGSHHVYGLVAHGSYSDFPGFPLIINYRNNSWQTYWEKPGIRNLHGHYRSDINMDYPYGFDMSLSDGWSDTGYPPTGPSRMSADILAEVAERFQRRIKEGPPRLKLKEIEGLDSLVRPIP